MDPEYFRADDVITLTPGEWQELVASIQNLVQANNGASANSLGTDGPAQ